MALTENEMLPISEALYREAFGGCPQVFRVDGKPEVLESDLDREYWRRLYERRKLAE